MLSRGGGIWTVRKLRHHAELVTGSYEITFLGNERDPSVMHFDQTQLAIPPTSTSVRARLFTQLAIQQHSINQLKPAIHVRRRIKRWCELFSPARIYTQTCESLTTCFKILNSCDDIPKSKSLSIFIIESRYSTQIK